MSKKQLTASSKSEKRRKAPTNRQHKNESVISRAKGTPIWPEVSELIRQGITIGRAADYMHKLGFLEDVTKKTLTRALRRWADTSLNPVESVAGSLGSQVAKASERLAEGMNQVGEIEAASAVKWDVVRCLKGLIEVIMKDDDELEDVEERDRAIQRYGLLGGMKALISLLSEIRRNAVSHAEIQEMLGITGDKFDSGDVSNRISEYAQRQFPGDEQTYRAFTNPDSRRKLLGIFRKIASQKSLYQDDNE